MPARRGWTHKALTLTAVLTENEMVELRQLEAENHAAMRSRRPLVRGDCQPGGGGAHTARPCPFVGCKYHLAIEVGDRRSRPDAVKMNFRGFPEEAMLDTCALDVADRGPASLEDAADRLNITRQMFTIIESRAIRALRSSKLRVLNDKDED